MTKQAAHPLFKTVVKGGTALGQKVRGMMTRAAKRSGKIRKKTMKKQSSESDVVKGVVAAAKGSKDTVDKEMLGADDPRYGGGSGNFKGKQAPAFTDKINPTDTPDAFGAGDGKVAGFMDDVRTKAKSNINQARNINLRGIRARVRAQAPSKADGYKRVPGHSTAVSRALPRKGAATSAKKPAPRNAVREVSSRSEDRISMGRADFAAAKKKPAAVAANKSKSSGEMTMDPMYFKAKKPAAVAANKSKSSGEMTMDPMYFKAKKPAAPIAGKAPVSVASTKPKSSSLGQSAGGGLGGSLKPSFAGGGSKLPARASMASLGKKPGFGAAGKLKAPSMPKMPSAAPRVATGLAPKQDTTAPKRRTNLTTGTREAS
ncbi:MAG: hypothetical protein JRG90_12585 [Deltaproteobacteria bacterium]|nr:hypothetical protein [Deltaproteobacteria bacterium]